MIYAFVIALLCAAYALGWCIGYRVCRHRAQRRERLLQGALRAFDAEHDRGRF